MRRFRGWFALLLAAVALPGVAAAQEPWKNSYYPYVLKGPNDKTSLVLHYHYGQAADYEDRVPFSGSLSLEAGANADGSWFGMARFKAPRLMDGWRFQLETGYVRENRFGYFGIGNETLEEAAGPGQPYESRVGRSRFLARGDVTRAIAGPLSVNLGLGFVEADFRPLPGDSRFQDDYTIFPACLPGVSCQPVAVDAGSSDFTGRVALVLDTRDSEFLTTRGLLVEGGMMFGTAGEGYSGYYGIARGFVPLWMGAVLGGRVMGRHLSEDATLDARYEVSTWERAVPVMGGPESHRSFIYGRYAGRDLILGNLEIRQTILDLADFGAVGVVAFLDAGRAKEGYEGESNDLRVGGGGGISLRILRSTQLGLNFAGGPDGFLFSMGTGWSF